MVFLITVLITDYLYNTNYIIMTTHNIFTQTRL